MASRPIASSPSSPAAQIVPPARTQIENDKGPNPLVINFSASVAPIARVGQEAAGVAIEPAIAGRWTWSSPKKLEFLPAQDWPVGQPYKVQLANSALAPHIEMALRKYEFTAPEFSARIASAEFYQDPVQANVRRALFQVRFSHPVNTVEFEKRLVLTYDQACGTSIFGVGKCASEKFTVSYDKLRLTATLQSEPLPIPEKTRPVVLSLTSGAVAQKGGPAQRNDVSRAVDIPGLFSLDIASVDPTIVTGENGEPEHVMHITASMPVHEREMARVVQAWLLPATEDAKGDPEDKFDWSAEPAKITDAVLRRAKKLNLQPIASEREVTEMVSFRMPQAEGGRYLLVRVAKGLKTPGGYQLGAARQEVQLLKTFAPELTIMSQGSLLALSGERKLPILVRDLPGIRLEIGRLLPQQLQHLVTQSNGDFAHPQFFGSLQPDNLVDRFQKEIPLRIPAGKAHYETVDFAEYLRSDVADRRGVFLLKVQGYDPKAKKKPEGEAAQAQPEEAQEETSSEEEGDPESGNPENQQDQRLVLVTDLGIVAKKSLDGTRDVFVQSIANGQPVAGALVEVWGRNGMIIASQATDATGAAKLPNLAGYQREKAPVVLVVRKDGDLSFLPFNRSDRTLDISRFDVGGLRAAGVPNQMTAYVFSDRGIYRPGDTMHIAMMVKAGNWGTSLRDLPLEAEIIDARGLSVRREKLKLGPGGAAEIAHATQDTSPTGNYTVNLYLPRESSPGNPEVEGLLIGSTTVKVQEFLPDRTKVVAKLSSEAAEGWVKPKDLKALIDVQNLFGTPAPDRKVEGTLTLSPAFPVFRAFADYAFFDPQRATEKQTDDLGSVQTSADGKAEFDLRLSRFDAATYQVHVLAKAFEPEGGRSVSAEAQTLVSDMPYLVGVKVDGDTSYVSKGAARNATVIAIDPQAKKTAVADLKIERVERKVLSVLVKQDNGLYRYESRKKDIVIDEKPLRHRRGRQHHGAQHRGAGQLRVRGAQCRRTGAQPHRVQRGGQRERLALARPQCRAATHAEPQGLRAGPGDRSQHPRAVRRRRPHHHRARQGLRACLVQDRQDRLGAEDHAAQGLRRHRLHQRALRARPRFGRGLHEPAVVWRHTLCHQPREAHRQPAAHQQRAREARPDREDEAHQRQAHARRAVRGGRRHPSGRALQDARPAQALLPEARTRSRYLADARPDPARVQEAHAGRRSRR
jgi:hypothetical protein